MVGINLLNFDSFMKKNYNNVSILNEAKDNLLGCMNELNDLYSGESVSIIFANVLDQKKDFDKISNVIDSYIDVLLEVKKSYEMQSFEIVSKINNTIN